MFRVPSPRKWDSARVKVFPVWAPLEHFLHDIPAPISEVFRSALPERLIDLLSGLPPWEGNPSYVVSLPEVWVERAAESPFRTRLFMPDGMFICSACLGLPSNATLGFPTSARSPASLAVCCVLL